jgi:hypothetical protein
MSELGGTRHQQHPYPGARRPFLQARPTMLYGALEDEAPFQSVRCFVEYEDYTLLRLHHTGIAMSAPFGVRGDHPRTGVPDRDGVLHRCTGDRHGPGRRPGDRQWPAADPPTVGRGAGPPTATSSRPT